MTDKNAFFKNLYNFTKILGFSFLICYKMWTDLWIKEISPDLNFCYKIFWYVLEKFLKILLPKSHFDIQNAQNVMTLGN